LCRPKTPPARVHSTDSNPARGLARHQKLFQCAGFHRGHFLRGALPSSSTVVSAQQRRAFVVLVQKGSSTMVTLFGRLARRRPTQSLLPPMLLRRTVPSPAERNRWPRPIQIRLSTSASSGAAATRFKQHRPLLILCRLPTHGAPLTRTPPRSIPSHRLRIRPIRRFWAYTEEKCSAALHPRQCVSPASRVARKRPVRANLRSFVCQQIFPSLDEVIRHARFLQQRKARSAAKHPSLLGPSPAGPIRRHRVRSSARAALSQSRRFYRCGAPGYFNTLVCAIIRPPLSLKPWSRRIQRSCRNES